MQGCADQAGLPHKFLGRRRGDAEGVIEQDSYDGRSIFSVEVAPRKFGLIVTTPYMLAEHRCAVPKDFRQRSTPYFCGLLKRSDISCTRMLPWL